VGLRVAADDSVWGDDAFPLWLTPLSSLVTLVIAAATVAVTPSEHRPIMFVLMAIAVVPCVALNWVRRPSPLLWYVGDAISLGAIAVVNLVGPGQGWIDDETSAGHITLFLAVWLVVESASVRSQRDSLIVLAATAAIVVLRGMWPDFDGVLLWLGGLLLAYLGGWLLHRFAVTVVQLREAEGRLTEEAVAAEQRRIAREVHDVVAHSVSVTALHLSAARMAADRGDLPAVRAALADAERLTRSSLGDLRRTVRMLRVAPSSEALPGVEASLPGLAELDEIVESVRAAGMTCELSIEIGATPVGELVELAAYRVVQQALTNAARHQVDASAAVVVAARDGALTVEVRSVGQRLPAGQGGHGIVGMRERVEGLGGKLAAGPDAEGWTVRAIIPAVPAPAPKGDEPRTRPRSELLR
jgi:signal transduction histidine kinase